MLENTLHFETAKSEQISAYARRMSDELGDIGYYALPDIGKHESLERIKNKYKTKQNVVLIGVGGSSLGAKAISNMLGLEIIFIDNLDESVIKGALAKISLENSVFIISSKSGTTIETISIYKVLLAHFKPKDFSSFIFITDEGSPLENYAKSVGGKLFFIPKNVGGRFSVLSNCGLVPLAFAGADIKAILEGAKAMKERFLGQNDPLILQKAHHYATHPNAKINVLFSYDSRLKAFNEWYIQLWAESLGKRRGYKRMGLTPVGLVGSADQHSFLQLIMDGPKDKSVTFLKVAAKNEITVPDINLEFLNSCDFTNNLSVSFIQNSQSTATLQALKSENISVDEITLSRLDEWHAGALIYYYELLTSACGVMLGVNTYDQPGVELGKMLLKKMLSTK